MRYAVITWRTEADILNSNGEVYCWVESLGCAINTALNLIQSGTFGQGDRREDALTHTQPVCWVNRRQHEPLPGMEWGTVGAGLSCGMWALRLQPRITLGHRQASVGRHLTTPGTHTLAPETFSGREGQFHYPQPIAQRRPIMNAIRSVFSAFTNLAAISQWPGRCGRCCLGPASATTRPRGSAAPAAGRGPRRRTHRRGHGCQRPRHERQGAQDEDVGLIATGAKRHGSRIRRSLVRPWLWPLVAWPRGWVSSPPT